MDRESAFFGMAIHAGMESAHDDGGAGLRLGDGMHPSPDPYHTVG